MFFSRTQQVNHEREQGKSKDAVRWVMAAVMLGVEAGPVFVLTKGHIWRPQATWLAVLWTVEACCVTHNVLIQ